MKVYYFILIAIGVMYTFHLAGIDTGSNQILTFLQANDGQNMTVVVDTEENLIKNLIEANTFWIGLAVFFLVAMALLGTKISAGLVSFQATTEGLFAAFASLIFTIFALDFISILIYMKQITGGVGWEFHLTWIIVVPFLVGFGISLVEFIRGGD